MPAWISYLFYETSYLVTSMLCTLGLSFRSEGGKNVPQTGPALLIANHQSFLDPVLIGLTTHRHLTYLARKSLFRNPAFRLVIRLLNAVPIDQNGLGKEGLKAILKRLHAGGAVLVFPEGTRTPDGAIHEFRPGISLLVSRSHCPIIPVGIAGAYQAWPVWRPYPLPAPLFLPVGPSTGTVAVSIGKAIDGKKLAGGSREGMLGELFQHVQAVQVRAEALRRRA